MSDADEPIVRMDFPLSEFQELAEWLSRERPAIADQIVQTWADIQASVEGGIDG